MTLDILFRTVSLTHPDQKPPRQNCGLCPKRIDFRGGFLVIMMVEGEKEFVTLVHDKCYDKAVEQDYLKEG